MSRSIYRSWSDAALLRAAGPQRGTYRPEALEEVEAELARRGIDPGEVGEHRAGAWGEILEPFEEVTRRVFRFLEEDHGYDGPAVHRDRDLVLVYTHPTGGQTLSTGFEWGRRLPFISIATPTPAGPVSSDLSSLLKRLNIDVSAYYPPPDEPRHREELGDDIVHFLEAHAHALRQNHARVMEAASTPRARDLEVFDGIRKHIVWVLLALVLLLFLGASF